MDVDAALAMHSVPCAAAQLVPVNPQVAGSFQCVVGPSDPAAGYFVIAVDLPCGDICAVKVFESDDSAVISQRLGIGPSSLFVDGMNWSGPAQGCYTGMGLQACLELAPSVAATMPLSAPDHNRAATFPSGCNGLLQTGLPLLKPWLNVLPGMALPSLRCAFTLTVRFAQGRWNVLPGAMVFRWICVRWPLFQPSGLQSWTTNFQCACC